jgi:peroxiredoxin
MNPRLRASPLAVLFVSVVFVAVVALALPTHRAPPPGDLRLILLDGRTTTLADLRGRPVLVAFWATSCAPCIEELPDLVSMYEELRPRGLEIVAVAMPYDPPLHVQTFVRDRRVPYPVALDVEGNVVRAFNGVPYVPSAFLLDPQGRVIYEKVGKLDIAEVIRVLLPFLQQAVPAQRSAAPETI